MTSSASLWNLASPVWLVAAVAGMIYLLCIRGASVWQRLLFGVALVLLVLAFVSPVGVLSDGYLFSAHMVQHLVLLLVVPLLLVNSLPGDLEARRKWEGAGSRLLHTPAATVAAWICGVGAMWLWHVPSLCSAATFDSRLGVLRDASLVAAGLAFWWPIYAPEGHSRLDPLSGIVYLFSACLGCTLLGIYITFTTVSVCPAFASPPGRIGMMTRLSDLGLTPSIDQHLGGLLMWVPPCLFYVGASLGLLRRWYACPEGSRAQSTPAESMPIGVRS